MPHTHDDLCAIPDRVDVLEATVIAHDMAIAELLKQVAGLRQQQIADATAIDLLRREARR